MLLEPDDKVLISEYLNFETSTLLGRIGELIVALFIFLNISLNKINHFFIFWHYIKKMTYI
jgi:hypothetical protein